MFFFKQVLLVSARATWLKMAQTNCSKPEVFSNRHSAKKVNSRNSSSDQKRDINSAHVEWKNRGKRTNKLVTDLENISCKRDSLVKKIH